MTQRAFLLPSIAFLLSLAACDNSRGGPLLCGGGIEYECPNYMFCDLGEHCGKLDQKGVCTFRPEECPTDDSPVCGCEGKTYLNACFAAISGESVAHKGPCQEQELVKPQT